MFRLMFVLFGWMLSSLLETDGGGDPPAGDGGDAKDDPPAEPFKAFASKQEHDDYVEGVLKERLERKDRKAKEEREAAERQAREKALQEQGEYKTVAEQRQETIVQKDAAISERDDRIEKLEADLEAMKPHRETNERRAAELMQNVPDSVKELLSDRDPLKQLEWLDKNPDLAGLSQGNGNRPRGSRPTGGAQGSTDTEADRKAREAQRQRTHSAI
jgi:hypothetical protein